MNNSRFFLLGFVTVLLVFLTGFEKADDTVEKSTNVTGTQINKEESAIATKKNKKKPSVLRINDEAELQKSLDLSMPFELSENILPKTEQSTVIPGELSNIFATEKKKKPRPVDLNGQMLMSQEPEADKQKSMDGAGILINLKQ
ncbi:MAG: hypothetical protein RI893_51 [Pseudomonadota bacterium]|jgi:hypothetical protein